MSIDNYSEEQLDQLLAQAQPQKAPAGVDAFSEEQLDEMLAQKTPEFKVVDEAHPAIGWKDRVTAKNFMNPAERKVALQSKYPNLQIELDANNEIIAKGKNEEAWRKLDPSSFELMDVADVGFDIASGAAETAGAIGGGLLGVGAGGIGALPAGMLGAGTVATGMDALKQKLGQYFGSGRQEVSGAEALEQGAISAALTPLGGVGGKGLTKALTKSSGKTLGAASELIEQGGLKAALGKVLGGTEKVAAELTEGGALGLAGEAVKKTLPTVGGALSGSKSKDIATYIENMPEIDAMDTGAAMDMASSTIGQIRQAVEGGLQKLKGEYAVMSKGDDLFNISDLKQNFRTTLDGLEAKVVGDATGKSSATATEVAVMEELMGNFQDLFKQGDFDVPDEVQLDQLFKMKYRLQDTINTYADVGKIIDKKGSQAGEIARNIMSDKGPVKTSLASIENKINNVYKNYPELKNKYRHFKDAERFLKTIKPNQELKALMDIDSKSATTMFKMEELQKLATEHGIDFETPARKIRAWNQFKDPSLLPQTGTATSINRALFGGLTAAAMGGGGLAVPLAAGAGLVAFGPRGIKTQAQALKGMGNMFNAGPKQSIPMLYRSGWNALENRTEDEINNRSQ